MQNQGPRDIGERTFGFAAAIVKFCYSLERESSTHKMLARQLLRSGTSIGANVEEAQAAQSKADFVHKMAIALKEARETSYWLRLMSETLNVRNADLLREVEELKRILGAIIVSARK
jgi:four helix bundle protein